MNAREAHLLVQGMIQRLNGPIPKNWLTRFAKDIKTLKAGGWQIGILAYRKKLDAQNWEWRNVAHFYNGETKERILFWDNAAPGTSAAERLARENPAPGGAEHFTRLAPPTECEKILAVKDKSQAIGEFLDWLQNQRKISLCTIHKHDDGCKTWKNGQYRTTCGYQDDEYMPFHSSIEKLLAEFFQIDLNKVEDEKQALLDLIRKSHVKKF